MKTTGLGSGETEEAPQFGDWLCGKRVTGNQEVERMMSDKQTSRCMWDLLVEMNVLYFAIKATPYSWVGLKSVCKAEVTRIFPQQGTTLGLGTGHTISQ